MKIAATALALLLCVAGAAAQTSHDHSVGNDNNAEFRQHTVDIEKWLKRLENPDRDVIKHRNGVIAALKLKPGQHVADVGAGTGAYMAGVSAIVGETGHYYAVDISPGFVTYMRDRAAKAGLGNVTAVLNRTDSATLPPGSMDMVLVVNTYHHFSALEPMLASMMAALKPGGELVVVEFDRVEGQSRQWVLNHIRADKTTFRREIEAAGFVFVEEVMDTGLEENFFFRFEKPR